MSEESRAEEQSFLVELYKYMKDRDTPIERIPFLGFKQSEWFGRDTSSFVSGHLSKLLRGDSANHRAAVSPDLNITVVEW